MYLVYVYIICVERHRQSILYIVQLKLIQCQTWNQTNKLKQPFRHHKSFFWEKCCVLVGLTFFPMENQYSDLLDNLQETSLVLIGHTRKSRVLIGHTEKISSSDWSHKKISRSDQSHKKISRSDWSHKKILWSDWSHKKILWSDWSHNKNLAFLLVTQENLAF